MALALALATSACASGGAQRPPVADELTVLGAASLRDALSDLESAYEKAHPEIDLIVATDSSTALRTQIELGAPADVFLSADTANPERLAEAGLTTGPPIAFARNRLTLIVPRENPGRIERIADLGRPGVRIVAAGGGVPVTGYAERAIAALVEQASVPADFPATYAKNVVSREDNVGAVVTKIALGEGDGAIVYATDARASDRVSAIPIPLELDPPPTYAGVVLAGSSQPTEARAFLEWLAAPDGQAILEAAGFLGSE